MVEGLYHGRFELGVTLQEHKGEQGKALEGSSLMMTSREERVLGVSRASKRNTKCHSTSVGMPGRCSKTIMFNDNRR